MPLPEKPSFKPSDTVLLENPGPFLLEELGQAAKGPATVLEVTPFDPTGKASAHASSPGAYVTFLEDAQHRRIHVLQKDLTPAPKPKKG